VTLVPPSALAVAGWVQWDPQGSDQPHQQPLGFARDAGRGSGCCQHPGAGITSVLLLQLRAARATLQGAQGEERQIFPLGGKVQLPQRAGGFLQDDHHHQKAADLPPGRGPGPGGTIRGRGHGDVQGWGVG